jgi:hypothetical protein
MRLAFEKSPHRFVEGNPKQFEFPTAVWINPPKPSASHENGALEIIISETP